MDLNTGEIVQLFMNMGAFGVMTILLWKRLIRTTDIFTEKIEKLIEKMEQMEQRHRGELTGLDQKYHQERDQREQELKVLTEKNIETMTKLELLLAELNRERKTTH